MSRAPLMGARLKPAQGLVASQNSKEQVEKRRPFFLGELGERGRKDLDGDGMARLQNLLAGRGQTVLDPSPAPGAASDQSLGGESVGKRSK